MKRPRAILTATASALLLAPSPALAHHDDRLVSLGDRLHTRAQERLGSRAPGRNVAVDGVARRGPDRPARVRELRSFVARLRHMLDPPSASVAPAFAPVSSGGGSAGGRFAAIRQCESGNDYTISTGNGFYGAYQFTASSWAAMGGSGLPHQASPAEQDMRAARLMALQGPGAWPVCGR